MIAHNLFQIIASCSVQLKNVRRSNWHVPETIFSELSNLF
jgi:hypothetical protein